MTVTLLTGRAPCSECGSRRPSSETIGYERALEEVGESDFPVLSRSVANLEVARNPKIEWLVNGHHAANYCQIIRTPFGLSSAELATTHYGGESEDELCRVFLEEHLRTVEQVLTYGKPKLDGIVRECGGVFHYLGRLPRSDDVVKLRPLRDLQFRAHVQAPDYDGVKHEYLSEISLTAWRG